MPANECAPIPQDILAGLIENLWNRNKDGSIDIKYYLNDDFSLDRALYEQLRRALRKETTAVPLSIEVKREIRQILREITQITNGIFRFYESKELSKATDQRIIFQNCGDEAQIGTYSNRGSAFTAPVVAREMKLGASVCLPQELITFPPERRSRILRHEALHAVAGVRDLSDRGATPLGPFFLREIKKSVQPGMCSILPQRDTVNTAFNWNTFTSNYTETDQEIFRLAANMTEVIDRRPIVKRYHAEFIDERSHNAFLYSFIPEIVRGIHNGLSPHVKLSNKDLESVITFSVTAAMYLNEESFKLIQYYWISTLLSMASAYCLKQNSLYTISLLKVAFPLLILSLMLFEYGVKPTMEQASQLLTGMMFNICLSSIARLGAEKTTHQLMGYLLGKTHQSPVLPTARVGQPPAPELGRLQASAH